jgi:hypothetical protein
MTIANPVETFRRRQNIGILVRLGQKFGGNKDTQNVARTVSSSDVSLGQCDFSKAETVNDPLQAMKILKNELSTHTARQNSTGEYSRDKAKGHPKHHGLPKAGF